MLGHGMLMAAGGGGKLAYLDLVRADGANHLWPLTETSGTSAADIIGSMPGIYVGTPTLNQAGPAGTKAITLNGSSQYLNNKNNIVRNTNFSYEALIKTTTKGGCIFSASDQSGANDKAAYINSSGNVIIGVYDGAARSATGVKNVSDGAWHHIVMSFSSSATSLYVDGVIDSTFNYISKSTNSNPRFGYFSDTAWPQVVSAYLPGSIAAPVTYPFAMSAAMAAAHAAAALG